MHYGEATRLHEQDDQEAVVYHQQADYAAANKVSVAIFIDRFTCIALSSALFLRNQLRKEN